MKVFILRHIGKKVSYIYTVQFYGTSRFMTVWGGMVNIIRDMEIQVLILIEEGYCGKV